MEWNNYFKQEKLICLKYKLETPTSPVIYHKNTWGNIYYEDITVKVAKRSQNP